MSEGVSLARRSALLAIVATVLGALTVALVLHAVHEYGVRARAGALRVTLLSASLNARDFLLTPRGGYDARVAGHLQRADSLLRTLPSGAQAQARAPLARYAAEFEALYDLYAARGLDEDSGAEGALRRSIHAVETPLSAPGAERARIEVLLVRRSEKDFLLRRRAEYVGRVHAALARVRLEAARAPISPASRDSVEAGTRAYGAAFDRLVALVNRLEVVRVNFERTDRSAIERLGAVVDAQNAAMRRALWLVVAVTVFGSALFVGATGWINRRVTRPLGRMEAQARRLAAGETDVRLPRFGARELDTLGQALGHVSDHVRERVRAETALRTTRHLAQTILHSVDDGIFVLDTQSRYQLVNAAVLKFLGVSEADLMGREATNVFPFLAANGFAERFAEALRGHSFRSPDLELVHPKTAEQYWYSSTYTPLRGADGAVAGVVVVIQDVTSRKRHELELAAALHEAEEASRFKSSLMDNLSHEIRTPLAGIMGYAQILEQDLAESELREFAQSIQASGHRLLDALTSLILLAELESGTHGLNLEDADVSAEVLGALDVVRPLAGRKGIALNADLPAAAVVAHTSAASLGVVLGHLLSNAVKFTDAGRVTVRLRARGGAFHLSVTDTGRGIDPAFVPHLFGAFRQASSGLTRTHEGAGIGLAITHRLAERLGGTVHVESAPGRGSTFTVKLPLVPAEPGRVEEPENETELVGA